MRVSDFKRGELVRVSPTAIGLDWRGALVAVVGPSPCGHFVRVRRLTDGYEDGWQPAMLEKADV